MQLLSILQSEENQVVLKTIATVFFSFINFSFVFELTFFFVSDVFYFAFSIFSNSIHCLYRMLNHSFEKC